MASRARRAGLCATLGLALVCGPSPRATETARESQPTDYHDGHARPRALAFNRDDGLLYVALSTTDAVAIVAPAAPARLVVKLPVCRFPQAVAALPGGGALVACRFQPGLRRIARDGAGRFRADPIALGLLAGSRGLALSLDGRLAYVASPALRAIAVVSLADGRVVEMVPTGISPRALRLVPAGTWPGAGGPWLVASAFIDHTVTIHPVAADGRLGAAVQTIRTEAPVLDLMATGGTAPALWLFTHEDRPVSRAQGPVEGLDSGVIRLSARGGLAGGLPLDDPGPGRRSFINLGDRPDPVIELGAVAFGGAGRLAIAGAGSDNLLLASAEDAGLAAGAIISVGANPSAVATLPDGRFVTADRLSDTLTFVGRDARVESTLAVGVPERPSPAERGEVLFYSRALVPHNSAAGPLSLYTCAACHDDGHLDGRLHPAKHNRFFSTTLTCRGLATTAPYLRLGNQATLDVFADNIVSTHAQGAERDPAHFADYPVTIRTRAGDGWTPVTLSPTELRFALSQYMARIPPEPSPFAAARALEPAARRGLALFRDRCAGCHRLVENSALGKAVAPGDLERRVVAGRIAFTSPGRYDVGTPVLGEGGNNPPSLRGVWDDAPYFSDGSARTLEEVLRRTDPSAATVHARQNTTRPPAFSADEQAALLAFLRVL